MRKLHIHDPEIMMVALQQEIIRSEESRYTQRLHGVLLVCSGRSCYEVADLLGRSPRTIQYWVTRFEHSGFAGATLRSSVAPTLRSTSLQEGERPGRPPRLNDSTRRRIGRDLRRSPRQFGYGQTLWDGKLLSHHLQERYDLNLGVRQCQRLFRQLGFRRRKPRPQIANADPAAQQAYKKTAPPGRQDGH
jgi:transposase